MMEFTYDGMVRYGFGFYNPNHAAALICAVMPFLWGWKRFQPLGWCLSLILTVPPRHDLLPDRNGGAHPRTRRLLPAQ